MHTAECNGANLITGAERARQIKFQAVERLNNKKSACSELNWNLEEKRQLAARCLSRIHAAARSSNGLLAGAIKCAAGGELK
jgi:hypothetical protein